GRTLRRVSWKVKCAAPTLQRGRRRRAPTGIQMRQIPKPTRTLLVLALAACFGGFTATALRDALQQPAAATPASAAVAPTVAQLPTAVAGQPLPSLAPMLARVTPAVVSVQTRQRVRINNPFVNDPLFRRMFPHVPQ